MFLKIYGLFSYVSFVLLADSIYALINHVNKNHVNEYSV